MFPIHRHRRLRKNSAIRALVRETTLAVDDFIAPLFVMPGTGIKHPISSLPGQYQFSIDTLLPEVSEIASLGLKSILLFGMPEWKDETGSAACTEHGTIQKAARAIKEAGHKVEIIADLCFCEYTSHGHCGVIKDGELDNDLTLIETQAQAICLAQAGVDMIAPSGMIDGTVDAIRSALDANGFQNLPIMGYSAKFASAYYGPFREAVDSTPAFGDRQTYQMDPANWREALREIASDIEEGADIVMVKPALAYLDIIARARDAFDVPIAAYNVSGEYAMIKAAGEKGIINEQQLMMESLLSIKRAGADIIISYFAKDVARILG
jgi:porphobilinogen synthase